MERKDLIMAEYAVYTFEDMEVEEKAQVAKANNANLSPAIRRDALDRLEVIEVIKHLFMEVVKRNVSPLGMQVNVAFYVTTGKNLEAMKTPTALTNVANGFISSTDKIVDVTVEKARVGLNKFANWLATKTNK